MSGVTTAPVAPGSLGEQLDPRAVLTYLGDLDAWIDARRGDLDDLDAAALAAPREAGVTGDLELSMALWKAVADRRDLLRATWNGGRVGPVERERLSALIWGRLDGTLDRGALGSAGARRGLALSLPEAGKLSDALVHQLRVRLGLDPDSDDQWRRLRSVREGIERIRDQGRLEPADGQARVRAAVDLLTGRADDLDAKARRGGDIGGLLGPLENDAARLERDLIVGGAERRAAADRVQALAALRTDLLGQAAALERIVAETTASVTPAPRLAVPDVEALGEVPSGPEELAAYGTRLTRVAAALQLAKDRYAAALAVRQGLLDQLDTLQARAETHGVGGDPDFAGALATARDVLARRPAPTAVGKELVDVCAAWLAHALAARPGAGGRS